MALAKTIKFSQIENASSYKRKAYQYSLSSIMLNNVKHECNDLHDSKVLPDLVEVKELPDLLEEVKVPNLDEEIPIINSLRKSLKKLLPGPSPREKKKVIKNLNEGLGNEVIGNQVIGREEKDAE